MKRLTDSHPAVAAAYFAAVLLPAMFAWNPVIQLIALAGALLYGIALTGAGKTFAGLAKLTPFFLLIALTNPLFSSQSGRTVLFRLWGLSVTREAVLYGIAMAVTVAGVLFWCRCMMAVLTDDKLLCLFGRRAPKLALLLSLSLRLIPLFLRRLREVSRGQRAAGIAPAADGKWGKIRSYLSSFTATVAWSMEHAMESAASMKARGYGLPGRTRHTPFRFDWRDGCLLSLILALLAATLCGMAVGGLDYSYYPTAGSLPARPFALTAYGAFGVLALLPSILYAKEAIRWTFFRSKI